MKKIMSVVALLTAAAWANGSDPFAGKRAKCVAGGSVELWSFKGMNKEFHKELSFGKIKVKQAGKYRVAGTKLVVQDYLEDTKKLNPDRIFKLNIQLNDGGYEFLWKGTDGSETFYSCSWVGN